MTVSVETFEREAHAFGIGCRASGVDGFSHFFPLVLVFGGGAYGL